MVNDFSSDRTAVIAIDLQNENLTDGAWPVEGYAKVLQNAKTVIEASREANLPIIYTRHWLNPKGFDAMKYEPLDKSGSPLHSVAGSFSAEISDVVKPVDGDIVIHKQRFTAFYGTKLDVVLNRLSANHLIILGVWTEACLETTVWDALWRDYRITIVNDACGSSTETVHRSAILDMANWLYGGMIITANEFSRALKGETYKAWRFEKPNAFPYTLDTLNEIYETLV